MSTPVRSSAVRYVESNASAMQVVEKAHPHAACAFSFVGAEATGEYGEGITRKQRQTALSALAEDITEVVEWPCHWRITPEVARRLVSIGRKELEQCGAGCCSLNVMARSAPPRPQEHASKGKPHPLWATAAFWKGPLQGMCLRNQLALTIRGITAIALAA